MNIHDQTPLLDTLLEPWRSTLGGDFSAYSNHCYRVLNFCLAFSGETDETLQKVSIAAAFHDLGIWSNHTFDYLSPSTQLAHAHLADTDQTAWSAEIGAMIEQHHKLSRYRHHHDWLVEPFRKADWVDVSRGVLRFGLPAPFVAQVMSRFPNAGFHTRLVRLTLQRLKTHPLSPFPMLKW